MPKKRSRSNSNRSPRPSSMPPASWRPLQGRITSARLPATTSHEQLAQQLHAFVDGAIEASGVLVAAPDHRSAGQLPMLFIVLIEPDASSALLEQAFAALDRHGGVAASNAMTVATVGVRPCVQSQVQANVHRCTAW